MMYLPDPQAQDQDLMAQLRRERDEYRTMLINIRDDWFNSLHTGIWIAESERRARYENNPNYDKYRLPRH